MLLRSQKGYFNHFFVIKVFSVLETEFNTAQTFTCPKSTTKITEKDLKYVKLTINTAEWQQ